MKKYYKYDCFEEARKAGRDILEGDGCRGKACPLYPTCAGNKEFEAMEKRGVTDYDVEEAIRRERYYGVETYD